MGNPDFEYNKEVSDKHLGGEERGIRYLTPKQILQAAEPIDTYVANKAKRFIQMGMFSANDEEKKDIRVNSNPETLMKRKVSEAKEPFYGFMHDEGDGTGAGLHEKMSDEGYDYSKPIKIALRGVRNNSGESNFFMPGRLDKPMIVNGQHRLAVAHNLNPNQFIAVDVQNVHDLFGDDHPESGEESGGYNLDPSRPKGPQVPDQHLSTRKRVRPSLRGQ